MEMLFGEQYFYINQMDSIFICAKRFEVGQRSCCNCKSGCSIPIDWYEQPELQLQFLNHREVAARWLCKEMPSAFFSLAKEEQMLRLIDLITTDGNDD